MEKYSTYPRKKVFAQRLTPYSLDECCIFQYCTQMYTVCISSHDEAVINVIAKSLRIHFIDTIIVPQFEPMVFSIFKDHNQDFDFEFDFKK